MLFKYKAKNETGELKEGTAEVKDQVALARQLREEGFFIVDVEIQDTGKSKSFLKKWAQFDIKQITEKIRGVSLEEKMMFSRNLSVMIESGITITRSLEVLQKQTQSPTFGVAIRKINESIKKGIPFSEAIRDYPKIFDELYSSMIKVGEAAGNLDKTLNILADQLEKQYELRSKIKGAMTYPIIIVIAMTGVGILMMVTIVPQLEKVFIDLDIDLPITTQLVLLLSDILQKFWWLVIALIPVIVFSVKKYSDSASGKIFFSWIFLHLPLFKGLSQKINNAIFARNTSSLVRGGVPLVEALSITSKTLSNIFFQKSLLDSVKQIKKGKSLHETLRIYPKLYTPLMMEMVEVGEESGKLSDLLERVAIFYEGEVSDITDNMSAIVEPILMIFIGITVGFFAVSVMQPIYGMLGSL